MEERQLHLAPGEGRIFEERTVGPPRTLGDLLGKGVIDGVCGTVCGLVASGGLENLKVLLRVSIRGGSRHEENIRWLEIRMYDSARVGGPQSQRNLPEDLDALEDSRSVW